jgi:hypothetical protein
MLDIRRVLKTYADKPSSLPLYYKSDTHWNNLGAYLAFGEMMKTLSAWLPDTGFKTNFEIIPQTSGPGGDLARMMMRSDIIETYPQFAPLKPTYQRLPLPCPVSDLPQEPDRESYLTRLANSDGLPNGKPKALIFHDSFLVPMELLFSENFSEILYLWKGYEQKNVEEALQCFKPDVVIEEIVERHMFDFLLTPKNKP